MRVKQQFIGKDEYKNLQLFMETVEGEYFILRYTNELGFDKIIEEYSLLPWMVEAVERQKFKYYPSL